MQAAAVTGVERWEEVAETRDDILKWEGGFSYTFSVRIRWD